jgi:phosphohistidine phosphatase
MMSYQNIPTFNQLKRLIIIRHGEAEHYATSDHQRALTRQGITRLGKTRERLGAAIKSAQAHASLEVWVSDARRTLETWDVLHQGLEIPNDLHPIVTCKSELYLAPQHVIYHSMIEAETKALTPLTLVIIGHNPGLSELVSELTSHPKVLETGALVDLRSDGDRWTLTDQTVIE